MKFYRTNSNVLDQYRDQPDVKLEDQTGFIENAIWSMKKTAVFDTSWGQAQANRKFFIPRNKLLHDMVTNGELTYDEVQPFQGSDYQAYTVVDYAGLARYVRKTKDRPDIETDEEIWDRVREDVKMLETVESDVQARQDGLLGTAGEFMGAMGAYMTAPEMLPTYFVGIGTAGRAAGFLSKISKNAKIAAMEMGFESLMQDNVYKWRKDIHSEYSVKEALSNIVMAGGGAFTIGMTTDAVGVLIKGIRKKHKVNTGVGRASDKILAHHQGEMESTPGVGAVEFSENMQKEHIRQTERGSANTQYPQEDVTNVPKSDAERIIQYQDLIAADPDATVSVIRYDEAGEEIAESINANNYYNDLEDTKLKAERIQAEC